MASETSEIQKRRGFNGWRAPAGLAKSSVIRLKSAAVQLGRQRKLRELRKPQKRPQMRTEHIHGYQVANCGNCANLEHH